MAIATMVIRLLDDRTCCVQSAFTHFGLWQKLNDFQGRHPEPENVLIKRALHVDISVNLQRFGCN